MKIKEVCEKTGLTDKAIRTYIKEGLVNPEYDENYAGRRSYCFDDEDVEKLKNIVVLRKYNFSLKEINALFNGGAEADDLLSKHIEDMRNDVDSDIDIINSMINVSAEKPSNPSELCKMLDTPEIANKPIPVTNNGTLAKAFLSWLKKHNKAVVACLIFLLISILVASEIWGEKTFTNGAVETDKNLSIISESEAVSIAYEDCRDFVAQYDLYNAGYFDDGTWHIVFYNEPLVLDSGVDVVVDEKTQTVIYVCANGKIYK